MDEVESTCTKNHTEDGGSARNEAALPSLRPYYLSWYRLVFPPRVLSQDDERLVEKSKQQ